jgi:streptogramin lyase
MRWAAGVAACGLLILAGCGGSSSSGGSGQGPGPQVPKANPGGPYTGTAGAAVTFNGAASTDPQSQALTFAWNFGDGTTGSGINTTHIYPQVSGQASTTYNVSLTVQDTSGLSNQATTTAVIQGVAPLADVAITGVVATGQKPILGAHVYLLAASTLGYGQASISLLNPTETAASDSVGAYVPTGSTGNFSLTGTYTCTASQQLYLYALGGNAGSGANSSSGLLASIGGCPAASAPAIFAHVNEVTTVAAAYAFAGFATDATHVSSPVTALALTGIANAFASAANLATLATGVAPATTPAGNGSVPQAEINSLANMLSACVDLSNATSAPVCPVLFSNAFSLGSTGVAPTDTATAAINIAHNPWINATTLFQVVAATPPYTPVLGAAPSDFTIAVSFSGGGLSGPQGLAIDGSGNVWVTNFTGNSVTRLSSLGAPLSGASGYTGSGINSPFGIAVDGSGNAWIANFGNNSVTEITNSGTFLSGSGGYIVGGLNHPRGVAIDGNGNAWIANFSGNSIAKLTSTGSAASGSPFIGGGLNGPYNLAIDGSGNAWISNYTGASVTQLSSSGAVVAGSPYTLGGPLNPVGIALDSAASVWIADFGSASVTRLSHTGANLSGPTGYIGGGLGLPYGVSIDGSGVSWTASQSPFNITALTNTAGQVSGPGGYPTSSLNLPTAIAIDGSGNAWIANNGSNTVSELVGVTTPVVTPISAGLPSTPTAGGTSNLGTRP